MPLLLVTIAAVAAVIGFAGVEASDDGLAMVHLATGVAAAVGALALAAGSLLRGA